MNFKPKNPLHLREAWVICFVLGLVMLNFPFLHIFNKSDSIFGFPLLFIYFTLGWAVSIAVIYLFTLAVTPGGPGHNEKKTP